MDRTHSLLVRARKPIRHFIKGTFGRLKAGANAGATYHDLLWTSVTALRTSSDAFPPLKGVVSAVVAILEISQRVAQSKKDAHQLAGRSVKLLEMLADVISDRGAIPPPMLASIERFESILEEIKIEMIQLTNRNRRWRLKYLNHNEGTLQKFNKRLDDTSREFEMGVAVRTEECVHRIHTQISNVSARSLTHRNTEMLLLRRIILMQAVVFLSIPRFGGVGGRS
ncbi:hypothetical protein B0H19DRAFT_1103531 [Mycena capillaripes]|nr:hypothetical protein B0H19DRAFT_1103531 [Mycena capillaripes]